MKVIKFSSVFVPVIRFSGSLLFFKLEFGAYFGTLACDGFDGLLPNVFGNVSG